MENMILWLLSVFISVIAGIVLTEPVHRFLASALGAWIPRQSRSVKGIWQSTFTYESKGEEKTEVHIVELRQIGTYVVGKSLTFENHKHQLKGRVRSATYFTGEWQNISENAIWHGAFQFVISNSGNSMKGMWVGFDSHREVQYGHWKWKLLNRSLRKSERKRAITDWNSTI